MDDRRRHPKRKERRGRERNRNLNSKERGEASAAKTWGGGEKKKTLWSEWPKERERKRESQGRRVKTFV